MTQYLPPNLLALFAPRDPIPYFPPLDVLPWEKKPWPYHGISECTKFFEVINCQSLENFSSMLCKFSIVFLPSCRTQVKHLLLPELKQRKKESQERY